MKGMKNIYSKVASLLSDLFYLLIARVPRQQRSIKITEEDGGVTNYYDILRGRDGLPGVSGEKGEQGEKGPVGLPGLRGPVSGGVVYTRWGKSSCPNTPGTHLLYAGRTGGTFYNQEGGGANYLCMPDNPEYDSSLRYQSGMQGYVIIHGAEYQLPRQGSHDHNVPCAVCFVASRETVLMIPAKSSCPPSWTREYYGYIMTEYKGHSHDIRGRTMFECVDKDQESIPGSAANTDGVTFHHVEASCNGLPCPPYNDHQELNCVVCTV